MNRGLLLALGATFLLAGAVVTVLYRSVTSVVDYGAAERELPAAVDAYRKDGLPLLAREIAPPHPPKDQDAAPAIRAALALLPPKVTLDRLRAASRTAGPESDALLQSSFRKPLDLLAKAVDRPKADFRRDWDLGMFVRLPESTALRNLARAASLRALRSAQWGDDASALRDLSLARQMALWGGGEPGLVPMLVRIALESIAVEGAQRCLAVAAKNPTRIARYRAWLTSLPPLPGFGPALRGEAFFGVTAARNLGPLDPLRSLADPNGEAISQKTDIVVLRREGLPEDPVGRAFLARHLQLWHRAYRATNGFRGDARTVGRALDALFSKVPERAQSYALVRLLDVDYLPAGNAIVNLQARRAVALAYADALVAHARTGRWPTSTDYKDPFTGKPLRTRTDAKGFRVWSVGRDGKDDGGRHRWELPKGSKAPTDEVAAYPPIR